MIELTKQQIDDMRTSLGNGAQPFTKEAIDRLCALALLGLARDLERASRPEEPTLDAEFLEKVRDRRYSNEWVGMALRSRLEPQNGSPK